MTQAIEAIEDFQEEDTMKGMYISFSIGDTPYALEIRHVMEIISVQVITQVPQMPKYVKGIINLRGTIIPVVDLRLRFNYEEKPYDERTCIIVISVEDLDVGLIVDEVQDVAAISDELIAAPPLARAAGQNNYVSGVARIGGVNRLLIDTRKLLGLQVQESLKETIA